MCLLLFVWALSSLKNVLQRTLPNSLPTPSQQGLSKEWSGTGSQFFLSKTIRITPARRQKSNKKEPRAIRNELLWTLKFYSVLALNAARKGTKLGAELGWFWVGQAQRLSAFDEKCTHCPDYFDLFLSPGAPPATPSFLPFQGANVQLRMLLSNLAKIVLVFSKTGRDYQPPAPVL